MLVFTYPPPKIRDKKLVYNKPLCIQLLRATTLLKILLKKKICVMSSFYLKFWVLLKVTMRDPLGTSRDGTDTQFLNLMEKYGRWRSPAIVELVAMAPTFQQHPQKE